MGIIQEAGPPLQYSEGDMEKSLCDFTFKEHQHISEQSDELVRYLQQAGVLFSKKKCKKRISIKSETYFEKGRLPLGKMWMIIVCLLKFPKMLGTYLAEILEVSENTLVDWGAFLRETISNY